MTSNRSALSEALPNSDQMTSAGLVRGIRRWDVVGLMINGTIGAGIFGLPSKVYALAGNYSVMAYVVCALVVALIALCYAEVSSRFTETGGAYVYSRKAFGPTAGFAVGWLCWLSRLSSFAFICNVMVSYFSFLWPPASSGLWRAAIITGITIAIAGVNIIGVKRAALACNGFAIVKLMPLILFIVIGLLSISSHTPSRDVSPEVGSFPLAVSLLFASFTGFEAAFIVAGEVRNPQRNLLIALPIWLATVATTYILIQVVCIGTLSGLAGSERPLADAANLLLGTVGAFIIVVGMLVSAVGTLTGNLLSGSRVLFAMAEHGELPGVLATTHPRFHTPQTAILLHACAALVLALSGTFLYLITLAAISKLMTFAATCGALPVLRRREDVAPSAFHLPAGVAVSILAFSLCVSLIANSGWSKLRDVAIALTAGMFIYLVNTAWKRRTQAQGIKDSLQPLIISQVPN